MDSVSLFFVESVLLFNWNERNQAEFSQLSSNWGMQATYLLEKHTAVTLTLFEDKDERRHFSFEVRNTGGRFQWLAASSVFQYPRRRFLISELKSADWHNASVSSPLTDANAERIKQLLTSSLVPVSLLVITHENWSWHGTERFSVIVDVIPCVRELRCHWSFGYSRNYWKHLWQESRCLQRLLRSGTIERFVGLQPIASGDFNHEVDLLEWAKTEQCKSIECCWLQSEQYLRFAKKLIVNWLSTARQKDVQLVVHQNLAQKLIDEICMQFEGVKWKKTLRAGRNEYVLWTPGREKSMLLSTYSVHRNCGLTLEYQVMNKIVLKESWQRVIIGWLKRCFCSGF